MDTKETEKNNGGLPQKVVTNYIVVDRISDLKKADIVYQENSQTALSGVVTIGFFVTLLLAWFFYTVYQSIVGDRVLVTELAVQLMALVVILKQAFSRYTYILTDSAFYIRERGFLRTKEFVIPYEDIDGICDYVREVFGRIKFRYKYRKSSSLDSRKVWELVYSVTDKKVRHGRVLIKANPEFFDVLQRYLPGRICVHVNDVAFIALLREEALARGYSLEEYFQVFEKERSAEAD